MYSMDACLSRKFRAVGRSICTYYMVKRLPGSEPAAAQVENGQVDPPIIATNPSIQP